MCQVSEFVSTPPLGRVRAHALAGRATVMAVTEQGNLRAILITRSDAGGDRWVVGSGRHAQRQ